MIYSVESLEDQMTCTFDPSYAGDARIPLSEVVEEPQTKED
jgi:hypothetical protein